jgi:polar amino acid transport system permease protein
MYQFNFGILWGEWGIILAKGLLVTLQLAGWSLVFALMLGLAFGILRWAGWLYVESARNIPPLVQILFWYFSASFLLPQGLFLYMRDVGYEFAAAVVALSIYHGSFMAEVFRAALNAVPRGQSDAARALGLGFVQRLTSVILPQALRIAVPPLVNETVGLAKNTSLAMAIGVTEIAYATKFIDSYTFRGVEALITATALYLIICFGLEAIGQRASRAVSKHVRAKSLALPARAAQHE